MSSYGDWIKLFVLALPNASEVFLPNHQPQCSLFVSPILQEVHPVPRTRNCLQLLNTVLHERTCLSGVYTGEGPKLSSLELSFNMFILSWGLRASRAVTITPPLLDFPSLCFVFIKLPGFSYVDRRGGLVGARQIMHMSSPHLV